MFCRVAAIHVRIALSFLLLLMVACSSQGKTDRRTQQRPYTGFAQARRDAQEYNATGMNLIREGHLPEALNAFKKAIDTMPNFVTAYVNAASVLAQVNRLAEAALYARNAIRYDPDTGYNYALLALILTRLNKPSEAEQNFRTALKLAPYDVIIYRDFAIFLTNERRFKEAELEYRRALEITPDSMEFLGQLARVLREQGKLRDAISIFNKLLQRNESDPETHHEIGYAWLQFGDAKKAAKHFKRAAELSPKSANYRNSEGVAFLLSGQEGLVDLDVGVSFRDEKLMDPRLLEVLEKARNNPSGKDEQLEAARALEERGWFGKASMILKRVSAAMNESDAIELKIHELIVECEQMVQESIGRFQKATELDPNHASAHHNFGLVLASIDPSRALTELQRAVHIDPANPQFRVSLAYQKTRNARFDAAEKQLREAIRLNPQYEDAYVNLGTLLVRQNRLAEAVSTFETVIRLNPKNALALNGLGEAEEKLGKRKAAMESFRVAMRIDVFFIVPYVNLGEALLILRELKSAEETLRAGLQINPNRAQLHYSLGKVLLEECVEGPAPELQEVLRGSAVSEFETAARLDPDSEAAGEALEVIKKKEHC